MRRFQNNLEILTCFANNLPINLVSRKTPTAVKPPTTAGCSFCSLCLALDATTRDSLTANPTALFIGVLEGAIFSYFDINFIKIV